MNSYAEGSAAGIQKHSRSIPLPDSHVTRTHSEEQLIRDIEVAEWQDLCMFYRVVKGIRERHNSHRGVPIYEQGHGRLENSNPPRWTNQDVAAIDTTRGNSFEFTAVDSPLLHGDRLGSSVALPPPSMRASIQIENGWSITGFDEDPQEPHEYAIIEEDTSDEGIFEMEL